MVDTTFGFIRTTDAIQSEELYRFVAEHGPAAASVLEARHQQASDMNHLSDRVSEPLMVCAHDTPHIGWLCLVTLPHSVSNLPQLLHT